MRTVRILALAAAIAAGLGCSSSSSHHDQSGSEPVSALAVNGDHACAVMTSGAVRCWGANDGGELGNSGHLGGSSFAPLLAASVTAPAKLVAGGTHTCATLASGAVSCWGSGLYGQIGNGSWADSVTPVPVSGLTAPIQLAAGAVHSCAVITGGAVKCWGRNEYGQLGDPEVATTAPDNRRADPVTVASVSGATAAAAGGYHSCALLGDGSVKCWGGRFNGSPLGSPYHEPVTISSLTGATAIAAGTGHGCAVVSGGSVKCWANNDGGQLGDGTVGVDDHPTDAVFVAGVSSATAVTAGLHHSCALLADGTVRCWGRNDLCQLGNGTCVNSATPVAVSGITGATAIGAGSAFTCALAGAAVKCWGDNWAGQLGLDPSLVQTSAVPVTIGF